MTIRLEVAKTYKLFIGGAFPRSESGRSIPVTGLKGKVLAHISHASRKDLRDAVEAAHKAQSKWADATAYNRGQVLYRMAEMLEGKKSEFIGLIGGPRGKREVAASIDRLVCFGGWADKYAQVLGCNNPVSGPFYNFTVPEPTGVVGVIAPDEPSLLGLVSLLAPPLCAGNSVVVLAGEAYPLVGAVFGEVCATSDIPAGVVNILTGKRDELVPQFASHREIDAIHAAGLAPDQKRLIREGTADNLKRVYLHESGDERSKGRKHEAGMDWFDDDRCHSPWMIEPFVEMKTMWHPSGA